MGAAAASPAPQEFEQAWWGDCTNTFGEEAKQLTYAPRMGLSNIPRDGRWPVYDLEGRSVLDIGGGPVSMLLKTVNGRMLTVVDPCPYPEWVRDRYTAAGIHVVQRGAENLPNLDLMDDPVPDHWDECWIYNVLQHVVDPEAVIATAVRSAEAVRIFEWLETPPCDGHPHTLHAWELDEWLGGKGATEHVDENGAVGYAYFGVFPRG